MVGSSAAMVILPIHLAALVILTGMQAQHAAPAHHWPWWLRLLALLGLLLFIRVAVTFARGTGRSR
ncbi:MAG: hypothetical protein ABSE85_04555 [Candidatus Korobacteraceae bacterium]|jgi:hypothetical protein